MWGGEVESVLAILKEGGGAQKFPLFKMGEGQGVGTKK